MRTFPTTAFILLLWPFATLASAGDAPDAGKAATAPIASKVVVRGVKTFPEAVRACIARAGSQGLGSTAAVVLDVTDETKAAGPELARALIAESAAAGGGASWQVASLGSSLSVPAQAATLEAAVAAASSHPNIASPDTLGRLRSTLKGSTARLVLYVAHEQFEDAVDLEGFIAELAAAGRVFCVIGTEAGFERPWKDVSAFRRSQEKPDRDDAQGPRLGTSPFAPDDPSAPWHSGETAYPLVPWRLGGEWKMEFDSRRARDQEAKRSAQKEMLERLIPPDPAADDATFARWAAKHVLAPDIDKDPEGFRAWRTSLGPQPDRKETAAFSEWFAKMRRSAPRAPRDSASDRVQLQAVDSVVPVASGFGPYGLMRAAGSTGGCYVLWRWGDARSSDADAYDAAKCDELAPDLRARSLIFAELTSRPRARALLNAWSLMSVSKPALCRATAPMWAGLPVPIEYQPAEIALGVFKSSSDRDRKVVRLAEFAARLARVRDVLAADAASSGAVTDAVDRRLEADVRLLLLALDADRFQMEELVGWAKAVPDEAWSKGDTASVSLRPEIYISERDGAPASVPLHDPAAGARFVVARKEFLDRYRGTPFGAIVQRNTIWTQSIPKKGDR